MRKILLKAAPLFMLPAICGWISHDTLGQWEEFSRSKEKPVFMKWIRETAISVHMKEREFTPLAVKVPPLQGSAGLFITLIKNGKVRGCFGAFDHSETDVSILFKDYLKGALSCDPRYKPIERDELDETEIVVTIASHPENADDLNNIDISRFGVFIECDSEPGRVFVPAEFRTASGLDRDNKYRDCRVSSFRAVTIREERK